MTLPPDPFTPPLLAQDEPAPVLEQRRRGKSSFVVVVDHAGRLIPRQLKDLGVAKADLQRHIAWDIGSLAVAQLVSDMLDAAMVAQNYSRLVIDCNRDPKADSSIPLISEDCKIPGNSDLSPEQRTARRHEIFDPYHGQIRALLDERAAQGRATILIALHSMTQVYKGEPRLMHGAVMYNRDKRFASQLLAMLRREPGLDIVENLPYGVVEGTDFTIPQHGEQRGLAHVGVEMRQDLVSDALGQQVWAERLAKALQDAESLFRSTSNRSSYNH